MISNVQNFFKKKADDNTKTVYTLKDFDDTFTIPKKLMTFVTLQMTHNLSERASKLWHAFYYFEVTQVLMAVSAEFVCMVVTAANATHFSDVEEIFRMMPCFGSCILALSKTLKIKLNRDVFESLYYDLRDMWPCGELSDDEYSIVSAGLKRVTFVIKGYYWCNNILLLTYLTPPFFICVSRLLGYDTRMVFCFEYWLPFDKFQPIVFETILTLQILGAMVVIYWNVLWDLLFCIYLAHINIQFELLARRVRKLFYVPLDQQLIPSYPLAEISALFVNNEKDALTTYTEQDWMERHQRELVDIVIRHHRLIKLAGIMESMCSFALLVNFSYSSIIICFCGFCCVLVEKLTEVAYKTFLLTALAQTWLLCWYGQQLIDASDSVSSAVYESGWYTGSKRIKSAVLIILQRAQRDIHVTTYGFSTISLRSFSAIIKTSWSYFTLLVNFYNRGGTDFTEN